MNDKLFDDFFKLKLEQYDSGSSMDVWEKVRRELHEKDNDKGVVWWKNPLLLLALLLFIGGGITISVIGSRNYWFAKPSTVENIAVTKSSNKPDDATVAPATTNETSKENNSTISTGKKNDSKTTLTSSDKTPTITNTVSSSNDKTAFSPAAEVKTKKRGLISLFHKTKRKSQKPVAGLPVGDMAVANLSPLINKSLQLRMNLVMK
ncbi:MAG: hypothetical protein EKK37_01735 [Sphingobacteriales bacterium]|nr:MAG: hypothetical protein EKK37_01735 [Sphingobacteriales bacterium]